MTQRFDTFTAGAPNAARLDASALAPADLARALLGCRIVTRFGTLETSARIVETEAYLDAGDDAAHIARGLAGAALARASGPGALYIHPMRGRCGMDIVAAGGSVLIRAGEPLSGLEVMAVRRGTHDPLRLLRGPACFTQALGITRALNAVLLSDPACPIRIEVGSALPQDSISTGPRIGISRSVELPLRFWQADSRFVSSRRLAV